MFFSQAQKEFTPSGCGGFFGGYRLEGSRPIQMTEDILCSSRFFFLLFSLFFNNEVHPFSAASKWHFQSHWTS